MRGFLRKLNKYPILYKESSSIDLKDCLTGMFNFDKICSSKGMNNY